jgi:hypothetical protein
MLKISQTLIKDVLPNDACGRYVRYRHIDKLPTEQSDLMLYGNYFEHHLIGSTRDGKVPEIPTLKRGGLSEDQKKLDELIIYAKKVCGSIGLDIENGERQVALEAEGLQGHLDLISNDIQDLARKAIYDIKWTATKYDDRWNGWADFESMHDAKIQASQYIMLYKLCRGSYVPYYFIVFGKGFWCRIIKVVVTAETMIFHSNRIDATNNKIVDWQRNNWPAMPEFIKCQNCCFNTICDSVAYKPTIEIFQI